jgi:two-component system, LytTR family, response regulator
METIYANNINVAAQHAATLLLPERGSSRCLQLTDIIRVEAESNYCRVYCHNRQFPIMIAKTLKWFEERLPAEIFTRVHHGHLVNRCHIMNISGNTIVLNNGYAVLMSRRKKNTVVKMLTTMV